MRRVRFLRNCAIFLPVGFLLAVFSFLLSHDPHDPALAAYPFLRDWWGRHLPASLEVQFFMQAFVLFLIPFLLLLVLVALVWVAERFLWRKAPKPEPSLLHRIYRGFFLTIFAVISIVIGALSSDVRRKVLGGLDIGSAWVAAAPFLAGVVAAVPAFILAVPVAAVVRLKR